MLSAPFLWVACRGLSTCRYRRRHRHGIAGGGTFITFPTLLATGASALTANVTTTVGSYRATSAAFEVSISASRSPGPDPLASAVVRARHRDGVFAPAARLAASLRARGAVAHWSGTVLFALAPLITKRLAHVDHAHRARRWGLFVGIFVVAIYAVTSAPAWGSSCSP